MPISQALRQTPALSEPAVVRSAAFLGSALNASRDCIKVLTLEGELVFMNAGDQSVMGLMISRH